MWTIHHFAEGMIEWDSSTSATDEEAAALTLRFLCEGWEIEHLTPHPSEKHRFLIVHPKTTHIQEAYQLVKHE